MSRNKKLKTCFFAVMSIFMIVNLLVFYFKPTYSKSSSPVQIIFWHSMGSNLGKTLQHLVNEYNLKQKNVKVVAQYQGSYDDMITKLKTSQAAKRGPDIVQVYEIGTRFMLDSGWVVPMQKFVDADRFNLKQIEPNLLAYYTVENTLWSMPFNSSTPILYYNKTAFREVNLDPNKPPKTFNDVETYGMKLLKKDEKGKVIRYGFSMAIYGWYFEQLLAKQGALYVNNGNGREKRATKVVFNSEAGKNILRWWKRLIDKGIAGNFGRNYDDTINAFISGKTCMIVASTASLKTILDGAGKKFEVGTGFIPALNNTKNGGVIIGGASLWILKNREDLYQKSAWDFVKFLVSTTSQLYWHRNTGYFPINRGVYSLKEMNEHLKKFPQFKTAIDQLHATPINYATRGALIGVFPEARQIIEESIEKVIVKNYSIDKALKEAEEKINKAIKDYNQIFGY